MASGRGNFTPVQTADRGRTGSFETYHEENLPHNAEGQLGQIVEDNGKLYRLVQYVAGAVTAVAGEPVHWLVRDDWTVTGDVSTAELGTVSGVAGGLHVTPTDQYHVYIQVGGDQDAVDNDGAPTVGDPLTGSGADNGGLTVAATLEHRVAIAMEAAAPGKVRWLAGVLL